MNKNDIVTVEITDIGVSGEGIGHVEQIGAELQRILCDEAYRRQMLDGYEYMASRLAQAGAPVHAAREMVALLKKRFKK